VLRGLHDGSLRPYFRVSRPDSLLFLSSSSSIVLRRLTVPDPLLLRKYGSAGNGTRTSGSVTRNSDHLTTQVVVVQPINTSNLKITILRRKYRTAVLRFPAGAKDILSSAQILDPHVLPANEHKRTFTWV
jgi:hypothetical protein